MYFKYFKREDIKKTRDAKNNITKNVHFGQVISPQNRNSAFSSASTSIELGVTSVLKKI